MLAKTREVMEFQNWSLNSVEFAVYLTDEIMDALILAAAAVQAEIPAHFANEREAIIAQTGAYMASETMLAVVDKLRKAATNNLDTPAKDETN